MKGLGVLCSSLSTVLLVGCGSVTTTNTPHSYSTNSTTAKSGSQTFNASTPTTNTSNTTSLSGSAKVYIFSQPMLKAMYATILSASVGPIEPPEQMVQETRKWAPKLSLSMLSYAPKDERGLDKQIIDAIHNPKGIVLLKQLPGYSLKHYQTPTGGRAYWWPSNNHWPTWVNPTKR